MKIEDYNKYYVQGSDHYLIPKDVFKELFNEMVNWKEESQKQKDNWNKLKDYIKTIYKGCPPYEKEVLMFITDKMQELEGSDSNE